MRIARWVPQPTNIHSEYVIFIAFPQQQLLRERASVLRYTYSTLPVGLAWFHIYFAMILD